MTLNYCNTVPIAFSSARCVEVNEDVCTLSAGKR